MDNLSGRLVARLAEKDERYDSALVEEINNCIRPPRPIKGKDVHIRAMYIVSDQINSQGGRFDESELDRLVELIIDSPVMVGHKRDSLPVARNFKAERTVIEGRPWVKSYFYWMRDSAGAEDLKNNIDGGIYKECSISFLFSFPECSICGEDIRQCRHIPFQEYETASGQQEIAYFSYRLVEKVLETSLVFRGAIPDTRITDKLEENKNDSMRAVLFSKTEKDIGNSISINKNRFGQARINCSSKIPPAIKSDNRMWVYPYQPGLTLGIRKENGKVEFQSSVLLPEIVRQFLADKVAKIRMGNFIGDALLYAVRGKDRLNGFALMQMIDKMENLHRLRLKIFDLAELEGTSFCNEKFQDRTSHLKKLSIPSNLSGIDVFDSSWPIRCADAPGIIQGAVDKYRFGAEVLAEGESGRLIRFIVMKDNVIPAEVHSVENKNKKHVKCRVNNINQNDSMRDISVPRLAGIDSGAVLLLTMDSKTRTEVVAGNSLIDMLPGTGSCDILTSGHNGDYGTQLFVKSLDRKLLLEFEYGKKRYRAVVHHFTPQLFQRGRKFIADAMEVDLNDREIIADHRVELSSIIRSGKVTLLKPSKKSGEFGEITELWFRPVLIDGDERCLFYAGGVNCPPVEL